MLRHPLVRRDKVLLKIFEVIERDEPSHWAPYEGWLEAHARRRPAWWERAIDTFIHSELLFAKLPFLFVRAGLPRRTDWPDAAGSDDQNLHLVRSRSATECLG